MINFLFCFDASAINLKDLKFSAVVALDGSGDFTSINEAILSVRDYNPEGRSYILLKKGEYREKVLCPANKTNITLIGEDMAETIIVWGDYASLDNMGTFRTWTLKVEGNGFEAENLTISNDAGQVGQAVALHVEGDYAIFRNCRILGNQDTIFTGNDNSRQYYENCYIDGTTDFIFGPATAWFEHCTIHCKRNSYITAASTPQNRFGYVFNNCTITADPEVDKVYLGRPWRAHAQVIFMNCTMGSFIRKEGWNNWRKVENEKTARYYEYNNKGDGACMEGRVNWCRVLPDSLALTLTPEYIFKGTEDWNPLLQ